MPADPAQGSRGAREWGGIGETAAVFGHAGAQFRAGADEPGFRRGHCDSQLVGHVAHGQALDVAEHHDVAHQPGNSPDFRPEHRGQLGVGEFAFRIRVTAGKLEGNCLLARNRFIDVDESGPAPGAHQHETLVGHNAGQPSRELSLALILIEVLKGAHDCILRLIFRVVAVPEEVTSHIDTFAPVTLYQLAESLPVPIEGQLNQIRIFQFRMFINCNLRMHLRPLNVDSGSYQRKSQAKPAVRVSGLF